MVKFDLWPEANLEHSQTFKMEFFYKNFFLEVANCVDGVIY